MSVRPPRERRHSAMREARGLTLFSLALLLFFGLYVGVFAACASSKDSSRTSTPAGETAARSDTGATAAADTAATAAADTGSAAAASADAKQPAREPDVIFVPTPDTVVVEMLRLAHVDDDDLVYDLGWATGAS